VIHHGGIGIIFKSSWTRAGIFAARRLGVSCLGRSRRKKILQMSEELHYYESDEEFGEIVSSVLLKLVREGDVEQLIGEDGEFYFQLTKQGKETMKLLQARLRENKHEEEEL
jgi:hypothetical protein